MKSLQSDKIPAEVAQHFSVLELDSVGALKPATFRYETDDYVSVFTMEASLVNDKIKGKLWEKKFLKDGPVVPVDTSTQKPFRLSLKYKICCSNHKPNDCVNTKAEAAAAANKKKCSGWRLIVI